MWVRTGGSLSVSVMAMRQLRAGRMRTSPREFRFRRYRYMPARNAHAVRILLLPCSVVACLFGAQLPHLPTLRALPTGIPRMRPRDHALWASLAICPSPSRSSLESRRERFRERPLHAIGGRRTWAAASVIDARCALAPQPPLSRHASRGCGGRGRRSSGGAGRPCGAWRPRRPCAARW